mmetsp:Transcript_33551/g.60161  ORF Transcript_33551/g.60161 Transcript_33551/m.60161 type:complete len:131 (-) Transcript_33551:412-804(-)
MRRQLLGYSTDCRRQICRTSGTRRATSGASSRLTNGKLSRPSIPPEPLTAGWGLASVPWCSIVPTPTPPPMPLATTGDLSTDPDPSPDHTLEVPTTLTGPHTASLTPPTLPEAHGLWESRFDPSRLQPLA